MMTQETRLPISADHLEFIRNHNTQATREFVDVDLGLIRCRLCEAGGTITIASYRMSYNPSALGRYLCIAHSEKSQKSKSHREQIDPFFPPKILGAFHPQSPAQCLDAQVGAAPWHLSD